MRYPQESLVSKVIFFIAVAFFSATSQARELPESLKKLRVLLVVDAQTNIGQQVRLDGLMMKRALDFIFDNQDFPKLRGRVQIDVLGENAEVTPNDVTEWIAKSNVKQDEAFLFFYTGHGGYNPELNGGHVLTMSGGELPRWALRKAIDNHVPAHFRMIITDSCTSPMDVTHLLQFPSSSPDTNLEAQQEYFETLFFRHRGTMDFNSSEYPEPSWTFREGSLMTYALAQNLLVPPFKEADNDGDSIITWEELFLRVKLETSKLFLAQRQRAVDAGITDGIVESKTQTPIAFSLAGFSPNFSNGIFVRKSGEMLEIFRGYELRGLQGKRALAIIDILDGSGQAIPATESAFSHDGKLAVVKEIDVTSEIQRDDASTPIALPANMISSGKHLAQLRVLVDGKEIVRSPVYPFSK